MSLYLVHLPVDISRLGQWAADRRLGWIEGRDQMGRIRNAGLDEGCALHHLLSETFGKSVLQPFRLMVSPGGNKASLYAYSAEGKTVLQETAAACALPEAIGVVDLSQLAVKSMPDVWASRKKIAFDLRLRPVKRLKSELSSSNGKPFSQGCEVDAFLVEALRRFPEKKDAERNMLADGRTREVVYGDWLAERFGEAADLSEGDIRLVRFERRCVVRNGGVLEGPDAVLQGALVVKDADKFRYFLERGIGRHVAYGYGMLLLRPVGRR